MWSRLRSSLIWIIAWRSWRSLIPSLPLLLPSSASWYQWIPKSLERRLSNLRKASWKIRLKSTNNSPWYSISLQLCREPENRDWIRRCHRRFAICFDVPNLPISFWTINEALFEWLSNTVILKYNLLYRIIFMRCCTFVIILLRVFIVFINLEKVRRITHSLHLHRWWKLHNSILTRGSFIPYNNTKVDDAWTPCMKSK